jgi:hypothetical protein
MCKTERPMCQSALHRGSVIGICLCIASCASPTEAAFENFKHRMQLDVGHSANDRYSYRSQYPERRVGTSELPNGNVEEQFRQGRGGKCSVFFEINKATQDIVAWRYEGTKEDCRIPL